MRSPYKKWGFVLLLAVLISTGMEFFPKPHGALAPSDKGERLHLAYPMPISSLDPYQHFFGAQTEIFPLIYSFLVIPSKNDSFIPDLASQWSWDEQRRTWTFLLNEGAVFHDGREVTCHDVKYSLERASSFNSVFAGNIKKVTCPNNHTITLELKNSIPDFLYQLSVDLPIIPVRLGGVSTQDDHPIGSGPYQVVDRSRDSRVLLNRFDGYFGNPSHIPEIEINFIPDQDHIWLEFMNDQIQTCWGLTPEQVRLMQGNPGRYRMEGYISKRVTLMLFNIQDPLFDDSRIRRALAGMLDIPGHIREELFGLAEPADGPLGLLFPFCRSNSSLWNRQPDWILGELTEAGWSDSDGDRYLDRDGQLFEFTLLVPQVYTQEYKTALYIQRRFNQFGIRAHIEVKRFDRIFEENLMPGHFQTCLTQHVINPRLIGNIAQYWSSGELGSWNYGRYESAQVDQALEILRSAANTNDLTESLQTIQTQLVENSPAIWLYHPLQVHAFSSRLVDFARPDPDFYLSLVFREARLIPRND